MQKRSRRVPPQSWAASNKQHALTHKRQQHDNKFNSDSTNNTTQSLIRSTNNDNKHNDESVLAKEVEEGAAAELSRLKIHRYTTHNHD